MVLRILPKLKSRVEGERIQYKDQILLQSMLNTSFLSFDHNLELNKIYQASDRNYTLRVQPAIFGSNVTTFRSYFSIVPENRWHIIKFSSIRTDDFALYGQDLVRIKHNEEGGYLCSQFSYGSSSPEVYHRVYTGMNEEKTLPGESLFEIEHIGALEKGEKFEFDSWDYRLSSKYSCPLAFKHFITGKHMSL